MNAPLPERVQVKAHGQMDYLGVAVNLCFVMAVKNHFNYFVFLDKNGIGTVRKLDYLALFDQVRNMFIMDYADPRVAFTGQISASVLQRADLEAAVRAYDQFRGTFTYPKGHRERIEKALAFLQRQGAPVAQIRLSITVDKPLEGGVPTTR